MAIEVMFANSFNTIPSFFQMMAYDSLLMGSLFSSGLRRCARGTRSNVSILVQVDDECVHDSVKSSMRLTLLRRWIHNPSVQTLHKSGEVTIRMRQSSFVGR